MQHTIQNDFLRITADTHGAELVSIFDLQTKREVLWQASPEFWARHAPILFPNVGRHFRNHYRINHREYASSQHGFARDLDFQLTCAAPSSLTYQLDDTPQTFLNYPYHFTLTITYTLKERDLTVQWCVHNLDENTMYFTIGGHPAFRVPVDDIHAQTDYALSILPAVPSLTVQVLDPETGTVLPEKACQLPLQNGMCPITAHMFDADALVFDQGQIQQAAILFPDGKPYVSLICDGFPNFGIWSKPGAPFLCLEPWMGRTDDYGFSGDLAEKKDINAVEPSQQFTKEYTIRIH